MHAHVQIRDIDQSQASCSREGGIDDEFLSESQLRSNEMEVVGVCPPLSKRPMRMVVCAIAGMQQGKSRAQHIPVRKPFAGVRKCVGATLMTLVKCLSKPFSAGGPFGGCRRSCYQFTRTRRCQHVYSRMKLRQSRRAMKGMTVRRAMIAALGRTTQISIHIHPPSLPPTPLDIIPCSQLTIQCQTKDFRKTFRQIYLRPHHGKTNDRTGDSNLCCKKKRERSTDANLKTVCANFLTNFYAQTFSLITIGILTSKMESLLRSKYWRRLCTSAYCLRPNDRPDAQHWGTLRSAATSSASAFDRQCSSGCWQHTCTILQRWYTPAKSKPVLTTALDTPTRIDTWPA